MNAIHLEMNYYTCAKEWAVIILYEDAEGVSCSQNWYFASKRKALHQLKTLEKQYQVQGIINA